MVGKETICWTCQNCTGNCNWSRELKPVDGWKVRKGDVSLIVIACPQYKADTGTVYISKEKLAKLLGVSCRSIYRYDVDRIETLIEKKKLNINWDSSKKKWFYKEK